ncbi:hypothetical protein PHYBLDRAFT_113625 [Phycomyces blakesleeanus NRRL 1555(-)]|uniref:Phox-like protein n=1 Tax=Phycomyces blakesleeanus (strain ATCC 8743b / DSM 1359 / FGSC 10004 / NBRC 33097 / NRRL 1555) TaxID=763407 RepID=A0A162X347_PHYB8|nr:hypothetical protein PHYBLDRAFT_113625 [Phycomyces blakesleeanus NRRL 1555(-)]OAD72295.1 hypothetical protein PHYBLDRAFT_113625 [Phycomyces blakesleeanus NRRL 1555(-)]|eukprot:XP_018290335.1 hypothetical protein PHYBLDRAFT_113625 [Phycomyces blakesleeanus NRRL 1555(-)]
MTEHIQAIFIRESETRSQPKPHTVYKIEVHAAVRNWIVWKRYSEFAKLNSRFLTIFPKNRPPVPLPSKHIFPSTFSDPDRIEDRRRGLEDYLRGMLSSRDDRWRQTELWKEFLAIPTGRQLDGQAHYTSESWLDEYNAMNSTAREIRSLINKRATHMGRDEISASHNCTMQAKKLLITLSSRTSALESGLTGLANGSFFQGLMSDGELRRRQDMLSTLKDERDTLMRLVNTGRQEQELLYNKPTSQSPTAALQQQKQQQQQRAKETEWTRGLDNGGLLTQQQQLMEDQDQQVEQFSSILSRQRQLGIAIGDELETQSQILDELDGDVGRTQTKLKFASKKLGKIK